jgi:hypothetical protein
MGILLRRREFIAGLGGAAAWPLAARAQQRAMPVIGYLSGNTEDSGASVLVSVRRGLADVGYAEGRNVAIEYLTVGMVACPWQLTDLTQRKVGVIVFAGFVAIEELMRKIRTSPIPIVFNMSRKRACRTRPIAIGSRSISAARRFRSSMSAAPIHTATASFTFRRIASPI